MSGAFSLTPEHEAKCLYVESVALLGAHIESDYFLPGWDLNSLPRAVVVLVFKCQVKDVHVVGINHL